MSTPKLADGVWRMAGMFTLIFNPHQSSRLLLNPVPAQLRRKLRSRNGLPLLRYTGTLSRRTDGTLYLCTNKGRSVPLTGLEQHILHIEHDGRVLYESRRYNHPI